MAVLVRLVVTRGWRRRRTIWPMTSGGYGLEMDCGGRAALDAKDTVLDARISSESDEKFNGYRHRDRRREEPPPPR
jgi:hypothetical protein